MINESSIEVCSPMLMVIVHIVFSLNSLSGYAKLMSEETLGSDPSSEGEEGRRRKRKGGGHDGEGERREMEVCDGEEKTREGEVGDGDGEQQKQQHPQTPHTVNNAE